MVLVFRQFDISQSHVGREKLKGEMSPSDWPVGKSGGGGQPTEGGTILRQVVLGFIRMQGRLSKPRGARWRASFFKTSAAVSASRFQP
jgi:hypothetical protein